MPSKFCIFLIKLHVREVYSDQRTFPFEWMRQEVFRREVQFKSRLVDRIPVRGCVWSKFEVIDKYEQIIKVDE
jgi:hypothetical protein